MLFRRGGDHAPLLVDEESARAAGADIDAEELDNFLLLAPRLSIACGVEVVDQFCSLFARAGNVPNHGFPRQRPAEGSAELAESTSTNSFWVASPGG